MLQAHPTDPTYVYFDMYGHGEPIRILFAVAKQPYVDKRISMEEWPALKMSGQLPFGSMPVVIGAQKDNMPEMMCQKNAILRSFGSKWGFYPKDTTNSDVCWRIDSLVEFVVDSKKALIDAFFARSSPADFDQVYKKTVTKFLNIIDERLKKNPAGCPFVGGTEKPTIADFCVVSFISAWIFNPANPYQDSLKWGATTVQALPAVMKWWTAINPYVGEYLKTRP